MSKNEEGLPNDYERGELAGNDGAGARGSLVVLEIDSPGGEAMGIAELAGQIRALSKRSRSGLCVRDVLQRGVLAGGGVRVVTASPTAILGSIGVVDGVPEGEKPRW